MESLRIILYSVVAAVVYGVFHDQITARICLEYFTVFHPPVSTSHSPTWQGLVWGVIATWWVGAFLGTLLAIASRYGNWPKVSATDVPRQLLVLMALCAVFAVIAGAVGYSLAANGIIWVSPHWADRIPSDHHVPFLIAAWAHSASYLAGGIGGGILIVGTIVRRIYHAKRCSRDEQVNREGVA